VFRLDPRLFSSREKMTAAAKNEKGKDACGAHPILVFSPIAYSANQPMRSRAVSISLQLSGYQILYRFIFSFFSVDTVCVCVCVCRSNTHAHRRPSLSLHFFFVSFVFFFVFVIFVVENKKSFVFLAKRLARARSPLESQRQ